MIEIVHVGEIRVGDVWVANDNWCYRITSKERDGTFKGGAISAAGGMFGVTWDEEGRAIKPDSSRYDLHRLIERSRRPKPVSVVGPALAFLWVLVLVVTVWMIWWGFP